MRRPWRRVPLVLFVRSRHGGWALLLGLVLAVLLLTTEREVAVPLFGTTTTTVFVWPLLATMPTALALSPTTASWESRSARPVPLLHAAVVAGVVGESAGALLWSAPAGWPSALALYLVLQAVTIAGARVLGDWAWMPVVGLGSLLVFNSPFVTESVVRFTDVHWRELTAGAVVLSLAALATPPSNVRLRSRSALGRAQRRAD